MIKLHRGARGGVVVQGDRAGGIRVRRGESGLIASAQFGRGLHRLNAGTLTTAINTAAPPAGGSYATFITDTNGLRLGAINGVAGFAAVPEPST